MFLFLVQLVEKQKITGYFRNLWNVAVEEELKHRLTDIVLDKRRVFRWCR